jgi:hypothetical protein
MRRFAAPWQIAGPLMPAGYSSDVPFRVDA